MKNNKYPFQNLIIFENKNFSIWQDWEVPIQGFLYFHQKEK